MIEKIKRALASVRFAVIRRLSTNGGASPGYMGRTFAIGLSAGIFFFFGQLAIVFLLWLFLDRLLKLRFSIVIAGLLTFVSNPLTTPFILYLYYLTGNLFLGGQAMPFADLMRRLSKMMSEFDTVGLFDGFDVVFKGVMKPIIYGSIPWHIIMALVGYWLGARAYARISAAIKKRKERKSSN